MRNAGNSSAIDQNAAGGVQSQRQLPSITYCSNYYCFEVRSTASTNLYLKEIQLSAAWLRFILLLLPRRMASSKLPPELWLRILDWATLVPHAFDTHAPRLFAYPGPLPVKDIDSEFDSSFIIKSRLTLVCKLWNALATPLLYKGVVVRRESAIARLLDTLATSRTLGRSATSEGSGELGRWTQRLDIAFGENADSEEAVSLLESVISRLPNLEIVVERGKMLHRMWHWNVPASIFRALASSCAGSLRSLRCTNAVEIGPVSQLANAAPLRILDCPNMHKYRSAPHTTPPERISAPCLEHLVLPYWERCLRFRSVGAVSSLSVSGPLNDDVLGNFLPLIGSSLKTLELRMNPSDGVRVQDSFARIRTDCTNLQELVLVSHHLCVLSGCLKFTLPSVEKIGFSAGFVGQNSLFVYKKILFEFPAALPASCRVVRFLDRTSSAVIRDEPEWPITAAVQACAERGIRLEDYTGCAVSVL